METAADRFADLAVRPGQQGADRSCTQPQHAGNLIVAQVFHPQPDAFQFPRRKTDLRQSPQIDRIELHGANVQEIKVEIVRDLRDERLHSGPVRIARYLDMLTAAAGGQRRPELISEGEAMEIAFNPQFLIDILKNSDDDVVVMELTGSLNPALVRPMKDANYLCVVMPMRL